MIFLQAVAISHGAPATTFNRNNKTRINDSLKRTVKYNKAE